MSSEAVVKRAGELLTELTTPHLRKAINATGIILHTGLGRAVYAPSVVDSVAAEMKGYCTLAIDRESGERVERDELVEYILRELTGAEAATVVCNNAAGTMLTLAALAAGKEVIVSRGQLIEIGGSFRLPEVMAQSRARLVEVGATNRTHLKDYKNALTPETAALMRKAGASACTDITGFGLFGHLMRLARQSKLSAQVNVDSLPTFNGVLDAIRSGVIPGAVERNREFVGNHLKVESGIDEARVTLGFDAQTSGGLLIAVPADHIKVLMRSCQMVASSTDATLTQALLEFGAIFPRAVI